jgi:cell wall-associated NlpC family hydrolase
VRTAPYRRQGVARLQIVSLALNLAGIPYVFGGSDIDGFDCSGLVFYVYDCFGIRLPRGAAEQAGLAGAVSWKRASMGDILVFKLANGWHSAIYSGDDRFVHAPNTGGWVRIETMNDYWLRCLKRVIAILP